MGFDNEAHYFFRQTFKASKKTESKKRVREAHQGQKSDIF